MPRRNYPLLSLVAALLLVLAISPSAIAQIGGGTTGDVVPRDVREIYDAGLEYLVATQSDQGNWVEGQSGCGTTGLGLLAMLACGEDPNFGKYSSPIRKAIQSLIRTQSSSTGYLGDSMYHHGFATLALAEAYGLVDETDLWSASGPALGKERSIGEALELAVRCAITSQSKNPNRAWRYSPGSRDADTSVSGAVLMGLLAARNAGIEVPDKNIDDSIKYFSTMTGDNGTVGYSGGLGGFGQSIARSSIACLVYSIAKRKDLDSYKATKQYVTTNMNETSHYTEYSRYYQAQALFQADLEAWDKWNRSLIRKLKATQRADGSFSGQFGNSVSTSLNLLSIAVNYRFLPIYER